MTMPRRPPLRPEGDPTMEFRAAVEETDEGSTNPFAVVLGAVFILAAVAVITLWLVFYVHLLFEAGKVGWELL